MLAAVIHNTDNVATPAVITQASQYTGPLRAYGPFSKDDHVEGSFAATA